MRNLALPSFMHSMAPRIVLAVAPVLMIMVVGAVLLLIEHYRATVADLQESRFVYSAGELRTSAESSLRLGLPLADLDQIESSMADALDRDIAILSIDLFDDQGRLLFTTDRAGIGEAVPEAWTRATMETPTDFWRRTERGVAVLGMPIINTFEQTVGGLALRYDPGGGVTGRSGGIQHVYQGALVIGVGILVLVWLVAILVLRRPEQRIAAAADRLDRSETDEPTAAGPGRGAGEPRPVGSGQERQGRFLATVRSARSLMARTGQEIDRIDEKD